MEQLKLDQMTPIERNLALNQGKEVDRLPCVPIVGNTAARVIGVKVSEFKGNGKLLAQAHVEAYKKFGYDNIRIFTDLYTQAEAMGAEVFNPTDETAFLAKPAIDNVADITRLEPVDPYKDGDLPQHLEAMKIALDAVGKEVPVTGALTGPFTNASFLIGADIVTRLMIKNPQAVHNLCEISLESNLRYAKAIIDLGCTPSLTDAMSSSTVISPKQFREFSLPYLKRIIDYIHSRGKSVTLHICGKTHLIWEGMVEAGADCLSIDNAASLKDASKEVGDRVKLMGNIQPSEVMLLGNAAEVRKATLKAISEGYQNPKGFIVASGCSLPTETPFANIHTTINTVREVGYPVNADLLGEVL